MIRVDESQVEAAATQLLDVFQEEEVPELEAIAALMSCVKALASRCDDPDTVLDWAVRRLDDEDD